MIMNNLINRLLIVLNGSISNIITDIMLLVKVRVGLIGFCTGNERISRLRGSAKMKIISWILIFFDA